MKDKKIIIIIILFVITLQAANAQSKTHNISLGIGFPNIPRFFFNQFDTKNKFESTGKGPYHFKYEYRLNRWIGVGASLNYMSYKVKWVDNVFDTAQGRFKLNNIAIENKTLAFNPRINFHFINPENHPKYDIYAGFGIGYQFGRGLRVNSDFPEYALNIGLPRISRLGLEASIGLRRQIFGDKLKIYTEIGFTKSLVQLGLNYQIN